MLTKSKTPKKVTFDESITQAKETGEEIAKILSTSKPITRLKTKPKPQQDLNQRLGLILSDD